MAASNNVINIYSFMYLFLYFLFVAILLDSSISSNVTKLYSWQSVQMHKKWQRLIYKQKILVKFPHRLNSPARKPGAVQCWKNSEHVFHVWMDPLISKYIIFLWQKDLTFRVSAETNLLLTWGWLIVIGCIHSRHVCASMMETCSRLMSRFINSFLGYLWSAPVVCLLRPGLIFGFSLPPCGFGGIWFLPLSPRETALLFKLGVKKEGFFLFVCSYVFVFLFFFIYIYIYVNNTWVTCIVFNDTGNEVK